MSDNIPAPSESSTWHLTQLAVNRDRFLRYTGVVLAIILLAAVGFLGSALSSVNATNSRLLAEVKRADLSRVELRQAVTDLADVDRSLASSLQKQAQALVVVEQRIEGQLQHDKH